MSRKSHPRQCEHGNTDGDKPGEAIGIPTDLERADVSTTLSSLQKLFIEFSDQGKQFISDHEKLEASLRAQEEYLKQPKDKMRQDSRKRNRQQMRDLQEVQTVVDGLEACMDVYERFLDYEEAELEKRQRLVEQSDSVHGDND